MPKCEICNSIHDGSYGSGRFCSSHCSHKFSGKKNEEINKKISNSLKIKNYKIKKCISCNNTITNSNSNSNSKYCDKCLNLWRYKSLFKKLNINDTNLQNANKKAIKILYNEYFINKNSKNIIFKKYNIRSNTLYNFFKKNNIKLRSLSEATLVALETGRAIINTTNKNYKYKSGWHVTWDNKKVYLRSSYEFRYAKELDKNKILYDVEKLKIKYFDSQKNKNRIAIPDFYLINQNKIVEIKSTYTLDIINMKDKANEYKKLGYNFELIIY